MAHGRNKYQSRENRDRVRKLFLEEWDPIGINRDPNAAHQYDRYADKAYVMLMDERATAEAIRRYLYWVATEYMSLTDVNGRLAERCARTATLLVAMRPDFETH
jgi:hypothetical protein